MGDGLSQDDLDNLFGDIQVEAKVQKEAKDDHGLSQDDLDNLFVDTPLEAQQAQNEAKHDDGLSQNDLDALFGDIQAEVKKPRELTNINNIETLEGSEVLSQDQIDELLKSLLNN
jgi:hypothetical protein